jgi:hypothetical protein
MKTDDPINAPSKDQPAIWLSRPGMRRRLWIGFGVLLALSVLAQLLVPREPQFGGDGWFGLAAVVGFVGAVAVLLLSRLLGLILSRPDDYYEPPPAPQEHGDA